MATFRCLVSDSTINYDTGVSLGTSTTSTLYLANTPIDYNSVQGIIFAADTEVYTFTVASNGTLTLHAVDSPSPTVSAGTLNLKTGKITLTWSAPPGANSIQASYTGGNVYTFVTDTMFKVTCPTINQLCSGNSTAFVAAVTVCNQRLFT